MQAHNINALAIDESLEYVRLALDGEMQAWVETIDSLEIWSFYEADYYELVRLPF